MKTLLWFIVLLTLGGCATPIPFNTVKLEAVPTVTSEKSARLELVTGAIAGSGSTTFVPIGTVLVPMSSGPVPRLQFHTEDQREFIEVLKSELLRLRVFREVAIASEINGADIAVTVIFAQTYHQIHNQEYTLDVVLNIKGGKQPFLRQYRVNSNEGASTWERINTNAYEGKVKAVKRLLEKLVPDIQHYLTINL